MSAPTVLVVTLSPDELEARIESAVRRAVDDHGLAAPSDQAPLLTKQALASMLAISTAGIDRLVRRGLIPVVTVGDVRRFNLAAVRAALDAAKEAPAPTHPTSEPTSSLAGVTRITPRRTR